MNNHGDIEARLWEYIDGFTSGEERSVIQKLIDENTEWKTKYQELLELHQSINLVELEQPSLRFTKNVMDEIAKHHIAPAAKTYINKYIIWGIGIFFITVIVGFLVYGFAQVDWTAASDSKSTLGVDLNKIDYGRMFNNNFVNMFMMLNVVLGLFLLDRFLANKRKTIVEKT